VFLAIIAVAIFDAAYDVLGKLGFGTGTNCPADARVRITARIRRQFAVGHGETACAVQQNRVKCDTGASTNRALYALLRLDAATGLVTTGVAEIRFTTIDELAVL